MHSKKKIWRISISAVLALLCVITIIGFRYAREFVVQRTVEAGITTMLDSGEISESDVRRILEPNVDSGISGGTPNDTEADKTSAETSRGMPASAGEGDTPYGATNDDTVDMSEKQMVTAFANRIMKQIPVEEQNQLMNMVLSRLSLKETIHAAGVLLDNSSSAEDVQAVKKMLYERFGPEEITILKSYYNSFLGK